MFLSPIVIDYYSTTFKTGSKDGSKFYPMFSSNNHLPNYIANINFLIKFLSDALILSIPFIIIILLWYIHLKKPCFF